MSEAYNANEVKKRAEENMKLVSVIARDYAGMGISMNELVSAGNLGLVQAAMRYNPSAGAKFSTYASYSIRKCITEEISQMKNVIPIHSNYYSRAKKIRSLCSGMPKPDVDEIAKMAGTSNRGYIARVLNGMNFVSLDDTDENGCEYGECIGEKTQAEIYDKELYELAVNGIGECLTANEQTVMRKCFGIGEKPMTLHEISHEMRKTYERIRQLQKSALKKMRCYLNSKMR